MTQDRAFQQKEAKFYNLPKGSWGLYLAYGNHDLKDYIKYKDKVEWIEFYKCGEGYWGSYWNKNQKKRKIWFDDWYDMRHLYQYSRLPIKNLKLLKVFTNLKYIGAYDKTGFTYGQEKEIHKIIKKRKLKHWNIIGISRKRQISDNKLGFMYCFPRSPRSKYGYNHRAKGQMTVYYRGTGRYKFSIQRNYIIPKFWKMP